MQNTMEEMLRAARMSPEDPIMMLGRRPALVMKQRLVPLGDNLSEAQWFLCHVDGTTLARVFDPAVFVEKWDDSNPLVLEFKPFEE